MHSVCVCPLACLGSWEGRKRAGGGDAAQRVLSRQIPSGMLSLRATCFTSRRQSTKSPLRVRRFERIGRIYIYTHSEANKA